MPKKDKLKMLINPYLFSLILFGIIVITAVLLYLGYRWYNEIYITGKTAQRSVLIIGTIVALSFVAAFFVLLFTEPFDAFGRITFYEDELMVKAPFRKTITLRYSDIQYIQIDYHTLSVSRQFWVILGKEPMPDKYRHQVVKLRFSQQIIRIPYCQKVDSFLDHILTGNLYEQYSSSKSALRA